MSERKLTEEGRLVFKFYKSYYDVFNTLDSDKDKLEFITAILERQFFGTEPIKLSKMANFAYISQKHNIDAQVKGFEDKIGRKLNEINPTVGGYVGGSLGGSVEGSLQSQSQSKPQPQPQPKEQINIPFEDFWNLYDRKVGKDKSEKAWLKLTNEEREKIMQYIPKYKIQQPDPKFRKHPQTFFNNKSWEDEILSETSTQKKFVMLYPQAGSTPTEFFLSDSELNAKTASGFWRTKEQVYGA